MRYGLSVNPLDHPEGPRGVFSSCGDDFRLGDLFYYYDCHMAILGTPWTTPRAPRTTPRAPGAFLAAAGPDFCLGDLFYYYAKKLSSLIILYLIFPFIKPSWSNGYLSGLSHGRPGFDPPAVLFQISYFFL